MGTNKNEIFNKINWLTVNQLIIYHTLLTVYKIRKTQEPEYLHAVLSRENIRNNIIIENTDLTLMRKSFTYRGSVCWNELPLQIKSIDNADKFKSSLKLWIQRNVNRFID